MSEVSLDGEADGDDDAIEGEVRAVPWRHDRPGQGRSAASPASWKAIVPEHLRTRAGHREGRPLALAPRPASRAVPRRPLARPASRSPSGGRASALTRIAFAQLGWWWVAEQTYLRHQAIADGDAGEVAGAAQARPGGPDWSAASSCSARSVGLVSAAACIVSSYSPLLWIPVGAGRHAGARHGSAGRTSKPIVTSAVVPVAVERLTVELIVRALGVLGIAEMNKALRESDDQRHRDH